MSELSASIMLLEPSEAMLHRSLVFQDVAFKAGYCAARLDAARAVLEHEAARSLRDMTEADFREAHG